MSKVMKVRCIQCGKENQGRSDKRFCSQDCKNAWHADRRQELQAIMGKVNAALRRNWVLLVRVLDGGYRKQVRRVELEALGFRWNYMTELFVSEGGRTFYLVYDCAWAELSDGEVLILRKGWREQV
jgi:predicted nucleic acid-binding Zn ribbon protein